jgi:hypothetical protein
MKKNIGINVNALLFIVTCSVNISFAQWIPQSLLTQPGQSYYPEIADVNKDSIYDIISHCNPGGVWLWAGDGGYLPNWTPLDTITLPGIYTYCAAAGDFNQDGNADLVASSWPGMYTWTGDGAANPAWTSQARPATVGFFIGCETADFNNDGVSDIAAATSGGSGLGINVWLSDGNANPSWIRQPAPGPDTTLDYHTLEVADVNRDGNMDIVAGHQNDNLGIKVWTGDGGPGGTVHFTAQAGPVSSGQYLNVAVGDINNDSNPDIVGAHLNTGIDVWLGDGQANPQWIPATAPAVSANIWGIALGDLNQDGNLDIVAANISSNQVQAWFGNGGQSGGMEWTPAPAFTPTGGYEGIEIVDLNRDGDPDVIAGSWYSNGVQIWLNDLTGVLENEHGQHYSMGNCVPNPFADRTRVAVQLRETAIVSWRVFDQLGRLVTASEPVKLAVGNHPVTWDGKDKNGLKVKSGTYFLVVRIDDRVSTKSVVLVR